MKVKINEKEVELKFNFKTELIYEEIAKASFDGQTTTSWINLFYSAIVANGGDGVATYKEYIDWLNENPDVFYDFIAWHTETMASISSLTRLTTEAEKKAKGTTGGKKKTN
jgi:hypothetical protein